MFRQLFYKRPPDHLLEISDSVYVFDCCFSSNVMGEDEYKLYLRGIVAQLQDHFKNFSFMVFNFREEDQHSQISQVLSEYNNITVLDYPRQYQSFPLLPLGMIHHFLKSSESWLSLEGQQNVLLMHCEKGGWPVLAFMLSGLLLYRKQYQGEEKTLEMVHKQAPKELLPQVSPSQLRYLQYITRRNLGPTWPPSDTPLLLHCLILRHLPRFEGRNGCGPILRVYGQDPEDRANTSSITNRHTRLYQQEEGIQVELDIQCRVQGDVVLEYIHLHDDLVREEMVFRIMFHTAFVRGNALMLKRNEIDIRWDAKDQFPKEFKAEIYFSGADAEVTSNLLSSQPAASSPPPSQNDSFSQTSEIPSRISEVHSIPPPIPPPPPPPIHGVPSFGKTTPPPSPPPPPMRGGPSPGGRAPGPPPPPGGGPPRPPGGGPPRPPGGGPPRPPGGGPRTPGGGPPLPPDGGPPPAQNKLRSLHWVKVRVVQGSLWFELKGHEVREIAQEFDLSEIKTLFSSAIVPTSDDTPGVQTKPEIVHLINDKTSYKTEITLSKVKTPLSDIPDAILAMDDTVIDIDLIEKLIKLCPTKEDMELVKNYTGDKETLGKCEKFFLELMKVPGVESKLNVYSYKIHFNTEVTELKESLEVVKAACEEVRNSPKLKEILKRILYLGNILNEGTGKGKALGFKLESLLKLSDTRAVNGKTLMHYLCKVIADKKADLLDFHKELGSLEPASKIQLNLLDGEMNAINKGFENAKEELKASETEGLVSKVFHDKLNEFITTAGDEAEAVKSVYSIVKKKADSLAGYFGEDSKLCPFEQVTATLLEFIRLFKNAHEENIKQVELEKKKASLEAKRVKGKGVSLT